MASLHLLVELPRFLQKGRAESVSVTPYKADGSRVAFTGATYTLMDADGTEVVAAEAATVSGNVATYELASSFADDYDLPQPVWRERWTFSGVSGQTSTTGDLEHEVYITRKAPAQHVTAESLYQMHSEWRQKLPKSRTNISEPIDMAWSELIGRLLGDGHLPHEVLNWWAIGVVHRYWAAHIVCRDFSTESSDQKWSRLRDDYWKRAQDEYEHHFKMRKDSDQDGVAETPDTLEHAEPELFLTHVPSFTGLDAYGRRR